ncbi:MAG: hypothetical protein ABSH13_19540 [Candidatus Acidiferrum sp.]
MYRCCQTIGPCSEVDYCLTSDSLIVNGCEDSVRGSDSRDNYKQFSNMVGFDRSNHQRWCIYCACYAGNRHDHGHERCGPDEVGHGDGYGINWIWPAVEYWRYFSHLVADYGFVGYQRHAPI